MNKIKVTVAGKAGTRTASVAALIDRVLVAQGATILMDEELARMTRSFVTAGISRMDSTKVSIKTKQLPRVKSGTLKVEVSQDEWTHVQIMRGRRMTGLVDHKTPEGLYYFWCWGSQPTGASRVTGETPLEAAENHLKVYERWEGGTQQYSITPQRKKVAA